MRFRYDAKQGEFSRALEEIYRPIAEAATAAVVEVAGEIKTDGRANIAAAGFGRKYQNALRVRTFPGRGSVSVNAAATIKLGIKSSGAFEEGATIAGKPYMWIPLSNIPPKLGRERMTPAVFEKRVGPLQFVNRGGRPLLVAAALLPRSYPRTGPIDRVTLAQLRRGAAARLGGTKGAGVLRSVACFVGVDRVTLPDKLDITEIVEKAAAGLPAAYAAKLNAG